MASNSVTPFVVENTASVEQGFTNFCYCSPDDLNRFAVSVQGARGRLNFWSSAKTQKLHLALINKKMVLTIQADPKVERGHISLNPEHCKSLDVSQGETVLMEAFVPPSSGFDLAAVRIWVDESSTPTHKVIASGLEKEFGKTFHHQVFSEHQGVLFTYKGNSYLCCVVEASLGGKEETHSKSLTTKQGMIRQRTKVVVEVPQSLSALIHGAETFRSVFRKEGFKMESLEEELNSVGIGGVTPQFLHNMKLAFGSRMVSPYEAKRWNLKHVRGMLLYGPPGSGKTYIARKICELLNAKEPQIISGPDVLSEFYGASERRIRSIFKPAIEDQKRYGYKSDLHIIIFDEFDSIAKKRGGAMGHNQHDDRIVNQLLTKIDGIKELNNIFIIATTNRKDLIDKALLRDGRIELHVMVDYPDEQGRLQILGIHTEKMRQDSQLDRDVNLQEIARLTTGYSGAALESLVKVHAWSHAVGASCERGPRDVKVTMNHFLRAIEDVMTNKLQESGPESNRMGNDQDMQLTSNNLIELSHYRQENADLRAKMERLCGALARAGLERVSSGREISEIT